MRGLLTDEGKKLFDKDESGSFRQLSEDRIPLAGLGGKILYDCKPGLHDRFDMMMVASNPGTE